ncbi:hypothetical protein [Vibrio rotiferianus]|uniref:hypothetical protein n=1 Tax=Vibrio rotiferianus TaxID=190895 RepID=UPI003908DFB1
MIIEFFLIDYDAETIVDDGTFLSRIDDASVLDIPARGDHVILSHDIKDVGCDFFIVESITRIINGDHDGDLSTSEIRVHLSKLQ